MSEQKKPFAEIEELPEHSEEIKHHSEGSNAADNRQAEADKEISADEKPSFRGRSYSRFGAPGIW